jgi:hypothetical protein
LKKLVVRVTKKIHMDSGVEKPMEEAPNWKRRPFAERAYTKSIPFPSNPKMDQADNNKHATKGK